MSITIEKIIIYAVIDGKPCLLNTGDIEIDIILTYLTAANGGKTLEALPIKNMRLGKLDSGDIDREFMRERKQEEETK